MLTKMKVVMFSDRVKSTQRMKPLTPDEIERVRGEQNRLTADVAGHYSGQIFESGYRGDRHLVQFSSCRDAVRCGSAMQKRVEVWNAAQTNDRLRFELHIGIDVGEVGVWANGDLQGNTVNRAARVCSECPPGQVYFTDKVKNELNRREAKIAEVGSAELKGVGELTLYRLVEWLGAIEPAFNPFIWRGGITKAEDFFDRDSKQRTIRDFLHGRQNCQIVGPRRIGKTSLLLQIQRVASKWETSAAVAHLDLQDPRCFTLSEWLESAGRRFGWEIAPATLVEFADRVENMLSAGHHPILCLDEFEEFIPRRGEFARDFFLTLRSCGQQGMSIVTTSRDPLSKLTEPGDPSSPFYNNFPVLRLGPFSAKDAEDFVNLHRPGVSSFAPEEKDEILDFAQGHPLALQVACFHVLQSKESGESLVAAIQKAGDEMRVVHPSAWR